jgi:hypothetical protein
MSQNALLILEIMSPLPEHESLKKSPSRLLKVPDIECLHPSNQSKCQPADYSKAYPFLFHALGMDSTT